MLFLQRPSSLIPARAVERKSEDVKNSPQEKKEAVAEPRVWAIKLGTGGNFVDFCEKHQIIGIGWVGVTTTPQILQFVEECAIGDYVIYCDPPRKQVRICRVVSEAKYRDFDLIGSEASIDIWHYRKVEYPIPPIGVLDFHAGFKGRILDPRMFFWELIGAYSRIDQIAKSRTPQIAAAADSEIIQTYMTLRELVVARAEALNEELWQPLVVDYLRAQAAWVEEKEPAGDCPLMRVEARFNHGELGEETWRVRILRSKGHRVDWPEIEPELNLSGSGRLCFVSVFGFTEKARQMAQARQVRLMQASDFTSFLVAGKLRESIRQKLRLPSL